MNLISNLGTRSHRKILRTKGTRQPDQLLNQASWETRVSRATRPLGDRTSLITGQPATVDTLEGVDLLMRQVTPKWCVFLFFDQEVPLFSCFCQFSINRCVCRRHTTLQIGHTHEHTVRCQKGCLPRASGDVVVVSGPSMVSVVFRLGRSWLFCSSDFWLCLFVARFWLVDVS